LAEKGCGKSQGPELITGIWALSNQDARGLRIPTSTGLAVWDAAGWRTIGIHSGLSTDVVVVTLRDRGGSLWLGLGGGGLVRWRGEDRWTSWTVQDGLPGSEIWSARRDRAGRLWVSTNNGVAVMERGKIARAAGDSHGGFGPTPDWMRLVNSVGGLPTIESRQKRL
jgi:ligand-binding sensor domain-containing protein